MCASFLPSLGMPLFVRSLRMRAQGHVPKELWKQAGELGLLAVGVPEKYGGSGLDCLYSAIVWEEQVCFWCRRRKTGTRDGLANKVASPFRSHAARSTLAHMPAHKYTCTHDTTHA